MDHDKKDSNTPTPLSDIPPGQCVRLARIDAGRALTQRLLAMGLSAQVELSVVSNGHPGPVIISIRESKLVLGRGMADKIMVVLSSDSPE